jgi:hypothetical protein
MSPRSPTRCRRNLATTACVRARDYGLRPQPFLRTRQPLKRGHDENPTWERKRSPTGTPSYAPTSPTVARVRTSASTSYRPPMHTRAHARLPRGHFEIGHMLATFAMQSEPVWR